jgi:hypothetical protein
MDKNDLDNHITGHYGEDQFTRYNTKRSKGRRKREEVHFKIFVDGTLSFVFPSSMKSRYNSLLKMKGVKLDTATKEDYETFKNTKS